MLRLTSLLILFHLSLIYDLLDLVQILKVFLREKILLLLILEKIFKFLLSLRVATDLIVVEFNHGGKDQVLRRMLMSLIDKRLRERWLRTKLFKDVTAKRPFRAELINVIFQFQLVEGTIYDRWCWGRSLLKSHVIECKVVARRGYKSLFSEFLRTQVTSLND